MQLKPFKIICFYVPLLVALTQPVALFANNILVSNVSITNQNTTAGTNNAANFNRVKFDLSWENSWRVNGGPANWDAAWVFVKFRVGASNPTFTGVNSSGNSITVSSTANLRVGMPIRLTSGTGAFAANTIISSITNATQFIVNNTPTTALSNASIECLRIWEHAYLNNTGHTAPSGSTIDAGLLTPSTAFNATSNPALGVFIYRSTTGTGNNNFTNTLLRWNYGANGITDNMQVSVQVFAIEMVYVPQGSFYVGSGGTETGSFTDGSWTSGATIPFQITSEAALGIDNVAGKLWGTSSTGNSSIGNAAVDAEATLAASYPKGYAAFYAMKYEVTQGQYRDFLNTLTYTQQTNRTAVVPTSAAGTGALSSTNANRNGIDIQTPGNAITLTPAVYGCNLDGDANYNETVDGEWIACNWLSWMDGAAFLDWVGLRPMTELEYEKACKGTVTPVVDEYAWGNATTTSANNITNGGQAGEVTNTVNANSASANQANVQGPLRVGAFAGAATTRAQAGATYYGILEMSGNLLERSVTIGEATGRAYNGANGDGALSDNGHANTTAWPGLVSNEVTGSTGSGLRGGGWLSGISIMRVSDRNSATFLDTSRDSNSGFRGVRSAQ